MDSRACALPRHQCHPSHPPPRVVRSPRSGRARWRERSAVRRRHPSGRRTPRARACPPSASADPGPRAPAGSADPQCPDLYPAARRAMSPRPTSRCRPGTPRGRCDARLLPPPIPSIPPPAITYRVAPPSAWACMLARCLLCCHAVWEERGRGYGNAVHLTRPLGPPHVRGSRLRARRAPVARGARA
jgi:hypothetical protein